MSAGLRDLATLTLEQPACRLFVDDVPLPDLYARQVTSVEFDSTWDGAAVLRVEADCWHNRLDQVLFRDEPWLQHPQKVDVWAGYGKADGLLGRFYMKRSEFTNGPDGIKAEFVGYDALERLMYHRQPRKFVGYKRTSDVVERVARDEYGFQTEVTPSPVIRVLRKIVKVKKGRTKVPLSLPPDHHKKAGDTDLRWLKLLADGSGYLYPHVRASGRPGAVVETFRFVPPTWERQKAEADVLQLGYRYPRNVESSLLTFAPSLSVAGIPTAVRVTGWDGSKWVTVEKEITPSGIIQTARGATPAPARAKGAKPLDPSQLYVEALSKGKVKKVPGKKRQESWGRDVLIAYSAKADLSVAEYAEAWLRTRASLGITGPATVQNMRGSELLRAGQVHAIAGVGERDSGWYIIARARHRWTGDTGHTVELTLERQAGRLNIR